MPQKHSVLGLKELGMGLGGGGKQWKDSRCGCVFGPIFSPEQAGLRLPFHILKSYCGWSEVSSAPDCLKKGIRRIQRGAGGERAV